MKWRCRNTSGLKKIRAAKTEIAKDMTEVQGIEIEYEVKEEQTEVEAASEQTPGQEG